MDRAGVSSEPPHLSSNPGSVLHDCVTLGMFLYLCVAQSHLEDGENNVICCMGWLWSSKVT